MKKQFLKVLFFILVILFFYFSDIRFCPFHRIFHIPCVGCGLTRAYANIFQGNIKQAVQYNWLSILMIVLLAIALIWKIKDLISRTDSFKKFLSQYEKAIFIIALIISIISWIININNPLLK